jgi:chromosome segregation ATPase
MNTDTPRTDASKVDKGGMTFVWSEFAQELERELAASKAEVERLQTLPESRHKAFLDLLARSEKAEAEVKEIRNALGDKGQRTHKELLELASKASHWREWKQKYIDLKNAHIAEGQDPAGTIWEHADKIQQELKASKAEVAKLNHQLIKTESDLLQSQDINSFLDTEFRIACKRAEKAEAEAIQSKAQLNQALAIATEAHEVIGQFFRGIDYTRIGMEIYELKKSI